MQHTYEKFDKSLVSLVSLVSLKLHGLHILAEVRHPHGVMDLT
jgi:hypothetical protein